MEKTAERKSNLELLRIISMILILLHHFYYNNFEFEYSNININQCIVQFLSTFGKVRSKLLCSNNRIFYDRFKI